MESVDCSEAESRFFELLERVVGGERFTITRHGKPVAQSAPATPTEAKPVIRQAIEELEEFLKRNTLGEGQTILEMIEEGRRF